MKLFNINLLLVTIIGLGFTGCGGDSKLADSTDSIDFPTDSKKAKPTLVNGKEVKRVVASDDIVGLPMPNGLSSTKIAIKSINILQKKIKNSNSYTDDISTETCSNGGIIKTSLSGSLSNPKNGTYITTYNKCNDGTNTQNGEIRYSASILDYENRDLDSVYVDFTTNFTMYNNSSNKSAEITKGSNFTIQTLSKKLKLNISLQARESSRKYGQENAIYYIYNNADISYIYQTQGRIYIDNLNRYVDYDTSYDMSQTPFAYNDNGSIISGEARYIMSNSGRVKIVIQDTDTVITHIDAEGDGIYELSE